jgi:hypothetical protein
MSQSFNSISTAARLIHRSPLFCMFSNRATNILRELASTSSARASFVGGQLQNSKPFPAHPQLW